MISCCLETVKFAPLRRRGADVRQVGRRDPMQRYIFRRLYQSVLALLALSLLVFLMSRLTGDPTMLMLPDDASREDIAQLRHTLGLDQSWPIQYWRFISKAVQGDFGRSIKGQMPVLDMIAERLPY